MKASIQHTPSPSGTVEERFAEVEVPPDAFGRDKSFCTGFQVGCCLQLSRTGRRQITQLVCSLITDCLLSALRPQLARLQHIKEDFPVFSSKKKLQRAEKDNQSSRSTSVKLLLLLPHSTNPEAKPKEPSRVSSLQINTVKEPNTGGSLPGLSIQRGLEFRHQRVSPAVLNVSCSLGQRLARPALHRS